MPLPEKLFVRLKAEMKHSGKKLLNEYFENLYSRVSDVIKNYATRSVVSECGQGRGSDLCYTRSGRLGKKHVNLKPGECIVSSDDIVVSTVLGSCVSVCFYSDCSPFFGMNHFMLPAPRGGDLKKKDIMHTESGYYGINAMEIVINAMIHSGVTKNSLKAKVFGGGNVLHVMSANKTVGEQNVEFVLRFLEIEKIPVTACSVGGDYARKIIYEQHTHDVLLQKLGHALDSRIAKEEEELFHVPVRDASIDFFK
jgi:chemotaxis protein CheD